MSTPRSRAAPLVVLVDANVLYSRVLRDYVLYAADQRLIVVRWSSKIMAETVEHLVANVDGFTVASGDRLIDAMNGAFPWAQIEDDQRSPAWLEKVALPDEDDRHVLISSCVASADVLCTANIKDFPDDVLAKLAVAMMTPDELLVHLIEASPETMIVVHAMSRAGLPGATDGSTLAALRRAGAPMTANVMGALLDGRGSR